MGLVTNLTINITSINFGREADKITINFRGVDSLGEINMNGFVHATEDEYYANPRPPAVVELVKAKIVQRIEAVETEEESEN